MTIEKQTYYSKPAIDVWLLGGIKYLKLTV